MASNKLKVIADDTMEAIKALKYTNPLGRTISLDKLVIPAVRRSVLYKPDWTESLDGVEKITSRTVTVTRETTLEAASRFSDVCVLNFASAKNPGGGFLRGASAQEESIARSSALYHTLVVHPEFYEENKLSQNIMYLDYAIYSPDVPVIRNDRGDWLEEPYTISVVTSPAPNRSAIMIDDDMPEVGSSERKKAFKEMDAKIQEVFDRRIRQVLRIMAVNGHKNIVLGAWGCGVFGNDPIVVSKLFKDALNEMPFFENIVFAIYDSPDSEVYKSFDKVFK